MPLEPITYRGYIFLGGEYSLFMTQKIYVTVEECRNVMKACIKPGLSFIIMSVSPLGNTKEVERGYL